MTIAKPFKGQRHFKPMKALFISWPSGVAIN